MGVGGLFRGVIFFVLVLDVYGYIVIEFLEKGIMLGCLEEVLERGVFF